MGSLFGGLLTRGGKKPKVPQFDYNRAIQDQIRYNRPNISGPGGTQTYGTDANGNTTFTTALSPALQALFDRGVEGAAKPLQRWNMPNNGNAILAALMQRVGNRTGAPQP